MKIAAGFVKDLREMEVVAIRMQHRQFNSRNATKMLLKLGGRETEEYNRSLMVENYCEGKRAHNHKDNPQYDFITVEDVGDI